ncbi:hypothetical protein BX666DRAFT_1988115 [Dichotomocladium elegans]|nr:hypothetical protein BX666DRAFT_1988115 [Dichotomocladium elegans]
MLQSAFDALQQALGPTYLLSAGLGAVAGICSGGQGGIADELPPCDLLLTWKCQRIPNGISGDNVVIGRASEWMHIHLNSLYSRNLAFSYIIIDDDASERHPRCGCPMSVAPSCEILPNMFYGLVEDYTNNKTDQLYKVVHRPECIPNLRIDGRATEFLTEHLHSRLATLTNAQAQRVVRAIIDEMCRVTLACQEANYWDKRIILRIQKLLKDDRNDQEEGTMKSETVDRIYSRVPAMLERLGLTKYQVLLDGETEEFNISDVTRSFVIYFGVDRAVKMSRKIYKEDGLVLMGYNIAVGHDLVRDLSQLPAKTQIGYSSRLKVENTTESRLVEVAVNDKRVYYSIVFEAALSTAILALTGIGPVLSMYAARWLTKRYRSSPLEMGTSLNWSVSEVILHYTGLARDDWMACVTPVPQVHRMIEWFDLLAFLSTFAPVLTWLFVHPNMQGSISPLGHAISVLGLLIGLPWVIALLTLRAEGRQGNHLGAKIERPVQKVLRCGLVAIALCVLPGMVRLGYVRDWVYLYGLELLYASQWCYGTTQREPSHQAVALFMLGILGAVRLCSVA